MRRRGLVLAALDAPQADLQPPGARAQGRVAARRPVRQAHPLRRARRRAARRRRTGARVHPVPRDGRAAASSTSATSSAFDAPFLHGGVSRSAGATGWSPSFQAGTGSPLLLVSLKAGGTGLNLTAASQVIHYDRWWNPAVEDQATDRAWRIGQHRTVNVHKLVCEGTVEERIGQRDRRQAQARRRRGRQRRGVAVRAVHRRPPRPRRAGSDRVDEPAHASRSAPTHPGRLPATMMKVLAAEMSDPQRLRRGKRTPTTARSPTSSSSPGVVTCEVQGSRPTPYVAQRRGHAGRRMPLRRDITVRCTCPDDDALGRARLQARRRGDVRAQRRMLVNPTSTCGEMARARQFEQPTIAGRPAADRPIPAPTRHLTLVHSGPRRTRSGDATRSIARAHRCSPSRAARPDRPPAARARELTAPEVPARPHRPRAASSTRLGTVLTTHSPPAGRLGLTLRLEHGSHWPPQPSHFATVRRTLAPVVGNVSPVTRR